MTQTFQSWNSGKGWHLVARQRGFNGLLFGELWGGGVGKDHQSTGVQLFGTSLLTKLSINLYNWVLAIKLLSIFIHIKMCNRIDYIHYINYTIYWTVYSCQIYCMNVIILYFGLGIIRKLLDRMSVVG